MKNTGRGQLINRLTSQVGDRNKALLILQQRGHVDKSGNLTAAGRKRDRMTAAERAIDRASSTSGRSPKKYKYNPRTNRATLKNSKKHG